MLFLAWGAFGCSKKGEEVKDEASDIVACVDDSLLTMREVLVRIPPGLSAPDSAALFNSIVEGWIDRMLLTSLGAEDIGEMAKIDRMVETYRRTLVVAAYRRKMREANRPEPGEKAVRNFYQAHSDELILDRPVIKGIYVKLPSNASRLADVRRWVMTATPSAIDALERYGLAEANDYSFFAHQWTDWADVASAIPYRFEDPDSFVSRQSDFETSYGGMTYLLHISEYMPSGSMMPYDVARPLIAERLGLEYGARYEAELMRGLYAKARREGRLIDNRESLSANPGSSVRQPNKTFAGDSGALQSIPPAGEPAGDSGQDAGQ